MVVFLKKPAGSTGFHQIVDFLNTTHIKCALTKNPTIYVSLIHQFWKTASATTNQNREIEITATIDGRLKTVTEASIRRHLKLEDSAGINSLLNAEIFKQLALMGTSKGYTGVDTALFPTMLVQVAPSTSQPTSTTPITTPETSPSKITSSPSLSSPTQQSPPSMHTTHDAEEAVPMPHESPLHSVHSLGRDEGSLSLSELTVLCTNLSNKVTSLEAELAQTKQTYGTALTKLIKKVKKLEQTVKSTQARRRFRIVVSDDEEGLEDPSKQGRKITEIDQDPSISLVQDEGTSWIQEDIEIQEKISDDIEVVLEEEEPTELMKDQEVSTAAANLVYIRRSAQMRKDKGKAIMEEDESINKATQEQEKQEVITEANPTHVIDWSDPAVIRYHALQNRAFSLPEVRKNMCMYLINQGGYKMRHFKGMSYEDIRPVFEKVWDQIHSFVPMDSELEIPKLKRAEPVKRQSTEEEKKRDDSSKPAKGRRKKTLARKRASRKDSEESMKKKKREDNTEKEDLKAYLDIIPGDDVAIDIESLATKADGSSKNYKIFSEMLDDFDRQDVLDLHRLVKAMHMTSSPEGYDLMLWGDLKTLFEPDEEDEVWRNQQGYNLISWRLYDSCGIHILLMDNGIAIHMMIEKKYPLNQEMLSRMLSKRLEVDHESTMAYELLRVEEEMHDLRHDVVGLRGVVKSFTTEQSRVSTWLITCMTQLMDASGLTYQAFDSTLVGSLRMPYQRREQYDDLAETMIWYMLKKTCVELIRAC
ncbi:hypothetical protein Tco_0944831 [Tanacetum coccineum]